MEKLSLTSKETTSYKIFPQQVFIVFQLQSNARQTFGKPSIHCLSLELALAALVLGVGRSSRGERWLGRDLGNDVEGLAVGFPDCVVRSLRVQDTADGLVVEELGAAEDESVLEARGGDLIGLWCSVSRVY
jgi:hypothetical protein